MKTFAPAYFKKFRCIANKCRHNCCIGWEIDIDENTYGTYKQYNGALKHRIDKYISDKDTPHFILDANERCPFLNENNLCDIYTEMGENALCQICIDHPRYRNFYSSCTEIGLGLCCEEACRIILSNSEYFALECVDGLTDVPEYTPEEKELITSRNAIILALQNRNKRIFDRFSDVWQLLGVKISEFELQNIFSGLEYMEHDVSAMLSDNEVNISDIYLEQLAVYFIYRYFSGSLNDGMTGERAFFAYTAVKAVSAMCKTSDFEEICEMSRIYSSEIEYSEDNVVEILYRIGDFLEYKAE